MGSGFFFFAFTLRLLKLTFLFFRRCSLFVCVLILVDRRGFPSNLACLFFLSVSSPTLEAEPSFESDSSLESDPPLDPEPSFDSDSSFESDPPLDPDPSFESDSSLDSELSFNPDPSVSLESDSLPSFESTFSSLFGSSDSPPSEELLSPSFSLDSDPLPSLESNPLSSNGSDSPPSELLSPSSPPIFDKKNYVW